MNHINLIIICFINLCKSFRSVLFYLKKKNFIRQNFKNANICRFSKIERCNYTVKCIMSFKDVCLTGLLVEVGQVASGNL